MSLHDSIGDVLADPFAARDLEQRRGHMRDQGFGWPLIDGLAGPADRDDPFRPSTAERAAGAQSLYWIEREGLEF